MRRSTTQSELMHRRVWEDVPVDEARSELTATALGVPRSSRGCCASAGWRIPTAARRFLEPALDQLHDPFLLAGMREAVDRLLGAIARRRAHRRFTATTTSTASRRR